jgi:hypothetical protein
MNTTWFSGRGAFSEKELQQFLQDYKKYGHHTWDTQISLGGEIPSSMERIVNELTRNMGRLQDRLALTIIGLANKKLSQHSGDCTVYASLHNGTPEAGVCTCGYGLQVMRETGDNREIYSEELIKRLIELARTR